MKSKIGVVPVRIRLQDDVPWQWRIDAAVRSLFYAKRHTIVILIGERKIHGLEIAGGSTVNRGHEHHRLIRCCSARAGRPRRFGGTQRDSGT